MNGLQRVQHAVLLARTRWRNLLMLYGIDVVLAFLFLVGYWWLAQRIVEVLITINEVSAQLQSPIDAAVLAQFSAYYATLLKLGFALVVWVFVLWCLGVGITLWKNYRLFRKHTPPLSKFLQRFVVVSAVALFLAFLISWGYVQASAWASTQSIPMLAPLSNIVAVLLLLGILYLLFCALQALESDLKGLWQKTLAMARQWRSQLFPFALLSALSLAAVRILSHATLSLTIIVLLIALLIPSLARLLIAQTTTAQ